MTAAKGDKDDSFFWDSYLFSYGEFGDIKIKLRVQVTAIAAASRSDVNLSQRGQSIILRQGTEGCPRSGTRNCCGGRSPLYLMGTAGCGCYGPTDSQLWCN